MWPCSTCHEFNDNKKDVCTKCKRPKNSPKEYLVEANESFDPKGNDNIYLKLTKGDIINVLDKNDEKWWKGKIGKYQGLFPANYVIDTNMKAWTKFKVIWPDQYGGEDVLNLDEGDIVTLHGRKGLDWLWVSIDGNEGWVHADNVEEAITDKEIEAVATGLSTFGTKKIVQKQYDSTMDAMPVIQKYTESVPDTDLADYSKISFQGGRFLVISNYNRNGENEITLQVGDIGSLMKDYHTGWCYGFIGDERGRFPSSHITKYENNNDLFKVIGIYQGPESDDLHCKMDDEVEMINKRISGWIWIKHAETYGWYPENHLEIVSALGKSKVETVSENAFYAKMEMNTSVNKQMPADYYNKDEIASSAEAPPLPSRRKPSIVVAGQQHNISNLYGNLEAESVSSVPPVLARRKPPDIPAKSVQRKNIENTYGNSDKLQVDTVFEYEEPITQEENPANKTDVEKIEDQYHEYDYIQEEAEKDVMHKKTKAENPELPKRPPPPRRPALSTADVKPSADHSDGEIIKMTTLYGKREINEIRIVMVGRTGSGKSATGNTLMGKSEFESKLAGESVTRDCKRGECSHGGRKVIVIDTPGLFDTKVSYEKVSTEIVKCVNMSTPGPHVFLLVIQIARFTDEEIETFNRLFDLFGEGMGNFAIITFTKLDDLEREGTTIESYIKSAPEKLREFLHRCNVKYFAIDNKANEKKKSAMVKNLIQMIDNIGKQNGGKHYTNDMYKDAEAALQRKIQEVERQKALEKKREIENIESKFITQLDSAKKENKKLAKEVADKKALQREVQREKDKNNSEIRRMKDEMKNLDRKRNEDLYKLKQREQQEKERQGRLLEEKDKQNSQLLQRFQQQLEDTQRRYQDMENQKAQQLAIANEEHNKRMAAEIQRLMESTNQKHDDMLKALQAKEIANTQLQQQMFKQSEEMNKLVREKDQEYFRQQEYIRKLEDENDKANATLLKELAAQKKILDETKAAMSQEQRQISEKQIRQLEEQRRINEEQTRNLETIKQQHAILQSKMNDSSCILS